MGSAPFTAEHQRLIEDAARTANWKRWGPYLSERQWGTVREDYSVDGDCWTYFSHDQARSRAYRWGEDGLLGFTDRECRLCFSIALWNGEDPILKERLFGLCNDEGNHGEDVKEEYFYLDSTPTHSYFKSLYKYPQREFPYQQLVDENKNRNRKQPEFELRDTGIFEKDRYFDVIAEYSKASPDDVLMKVTVINRGPDSAMIHLLGQLFYRNTWAWGCTHEGCAVKPRMRLCGGSNCVECSHETLGTFHFHADEMGAIPPTFLFTENETNIHRLFDAENYYPNVRDAFHEYVIRGNSGAINSANVGTKCAAYYGIELAPGASVTLRFRLTAAATSGDPRREAGGDGDGDGAIALPHPNAPASSPFLGDFEKTFKQRIKEADEFYKAHIPQSLSEDEQRIARQAYTGLLFSKQFYNYVVLDWLKGDPAQPPPPDQRWTGRNRDWTHLFNRDVIVMPDKWEYPWYATWDLAFHVVTLAEIDPQFAKEQLLLFLREWYMHPQGQLPAYEFNLSDVNPPVHAWACWRVYKLASSSARPASAGGDGHDDQARDLAFLERAFQKLLINFTWWVNRKDISGRNIFGGGFLGLDNIGVFDRSMTLPDGHSLEQADATAWMAFYCGTMLSMALELAAHNPVYEDVASKFFEHFVAIVDAINTLGGTGLWDDADGFYYDRLTTGAQCIPIKLRSMVGLIPLFAVEVLDEQIISKLPGFKKRMDWFLKNRADLGRFISYAECSSEQALRLLAVPSREKLQRMLTYVLDESEFLSPFGIRSLSKFHKDHPFTVQIDGKKLEAHYTAGESDSSLFGGNSNWRGPVWFPLNYLLIEALERYHHFYGSSFKIEYPTGSGKEETLQFIADELSRRLTNLFIPREGKIPAVDERFTRDQNYRGLPLFHE
ncbi:MAG TPA: hypothetical protein VF669_18825, partial [Tepidisphaeraceae bacterium]